MNPLYLTHMLSSNKTPQKRKIVLIIHNIQCHV